MRVCLLPAEILLEIFATFATIYEDSEFIQVSHATIAALARTCRTFNEPALDTLWGENRCAAAHLMLA